MASKIYLLSGGEKIKGMLSAEQRDMLKLDLSDKHNLVSIGAKREYEKNDIYFYGNDTMMGVQDTFAFSILDNFNLIDGRIPKEEGLKLLKNADII